MRFLQLVFVFLFSFLFAAAQSNSDSISSEKKDNLKVSLLTCGVGEDLYATFGHTAIRIINHEFNTDEVYNYGTFDYSDPDFYTKFTLGKLPYFLSKAPFDLFITEYQVSKRSVKEQELALKPIEKERLLSFLENNLLPENRMYPYDFLFDNCATRVRDAFDATLGKSLIWAEVLEGKKVSYRTVLNQYLLDKHWERFGIDLLMGSPVDAQMSDQSSMFLPSFLHKGMKGAYLDGQPIVREEVTLLEDGQHAMKSLNGPMWAMIGILILVILTFHVPAFRYLKGVIRFLLLFTTGALGVVLLFMWLGTEHASFKENYNILWALPFNIIVAFIAHKKMAFLKVYGLAGLTLIIVSLIVHVIGIQKFSLIELSPLFLSLLYIYIDLYKTNATHLPQGVTEKDIINEATA